jgi:GntR family transcriptional regulator
MECPAPSSNKPLLRYATPECLLEQTQIPFCSALERQTVVRLFAIRVLLCYLCSTVFRKPNPSSGVPIYVQLKEQIRHSIEIGALAPGDQLPGVRSLAEALVINPNTLLKVYRELEQEGVLEIRHGLGAFIASRRRNQTKTNGIRDAQQLMHDFVDSLKEQGLDDGEIRRLFEAEFAGTIKRR